jgi:hypothetical protein
MERHVPESTGTELAATLSWQELVLATRRLHLELRTAVRAGQLDISNVPDLIARLGEADEALDAWSACVENE